MQVLSPNRGNRYTVQDLWRFPRTRQKPGCVRLAVLSPRPLGSQPRPLPMASRRLSVLGLCAPA